MKRKLAMTNDDSLRLDARRHMQMWGMAFLLGTFGVAGASLAFDFGSALSLGLFMAGMLLMVPFIRASEKYQRLVGSGSSAVRRYNRRFTIASFAYVVALVGAIWLTKIGTYPSPVYVLIALAPAVPVLGMIWTMARLAIEEEDEYLRTLHTHHALVATGFVLGLATVWGFLEQFNIVPHIPAYWVFPAWAIGLGISQCWSWARS
jgi:hypothetical protein